MARRRGLTDLRHFWDWLAPIPSTKPFLPPIRKPINTAILLGLQLGFLGIHPELAFVLYRGDRCSTHCQLAMNNSKKPKNQAMMFQKPHRNFFKRR